MYSFVPRLFCRWVAGAHFLIQLTFSWADISGSLCKVHTEGCKERDNMIVSAAFTLFFQANKSNDDIRKQKGGGETNKQTKKSPGL